MRMSRASFENSGKLRDDETRVIQLTEQSAQDRISEGNCRLELEATLDTLKNAMSDLTKVR